MLDIKENIDLQKWALLSFYIVLGALDWRILGLYIVQTYLGWAFITLHNYGQHLPLADKEAYATSYQNQLYNKLFCNNGIHYEHHDQPKLAWHELFPNPHAPKIVDLPHLAGPFFNLNDAKNKKTPYQNV